MSNPIMLYKGKELETKDNKNIVLWFLRVLGTCLVIFLIGALVIHFYKGSNADLPSQPDAILRCVNVSGTNVTIQWEYPYLNETESYNAYVFASMNNCTFKSERFTIKELVMKGGQNETK